MTPEQFCYWLQGFAELNGKKPPTEAQWKSINEHLALVFCKVTPPVQKSDQQRLNDEAMRRAIQPAPNPFDAGRAIPFPQDPLRPHYTVTC